MKPEYLPCVEIEPGSGARCAVVWLHGLGADGHDFEPVVPELGVSPDLGVRFILPHAPSIPVTINGGMIMPAWYDIRGADLHDRVDLDGVRRSVDQVGALVRREVERGIPTERIVVAGFSQGGAVGLHLALRHPRRLAGVVALSTYLVGADRTEVEIHPANRDVPVFMAHGRFDPMVPFARGVEARDRLRGFGLEVTWKEYPVMHGVSLEEIQDIGKWLNRTLESGNGEPRDSAPRTGG